MYRRAVVAGTFAVATAGCVDRLHDVAASTPRDLGVRSRFIDGNPLVDGQSVLDRPEELVTHAASFRSAAAARGALTPDATESREFVERTDFVDDGGDAVLVIAQRLTAPEVKLRLGGISRTGDHSLRIAVDQSGVRGEVETDDPVVKTLLLRLSDERGPPERAIVVIGDGRAGITI
ncbi:MULTISPECIES: hypothetical protein [unclassified Halorubrum]|uniref:hypothetical protein n=1 Tax=unclassified Halorubrum TaxID=2642239 RepID=UPI0010F7BDFB|nr:MULTISPECIES: hypothetical protein [unclassified Halorubrum]TKX40983.1 hypothetical protein EXE50_16750 [Halorubrum sp. ARQ200]TKX49746.1 hypothetical protein EXE49_09480 [Halorubrum sp. ASP121]TKX62101.1 hypothetical protein EXE48_05365 [Halorubrum sp. ASP1]